MKVRKRSKKRSVANPPSGVTQHVMTLVGLGIIWYLTKSKPGSQGTQGVEMVLDAAPVSEGEMVSADSYRRISAMRPGMTYVPCTGSLGGRLTFGIPKSGAFTRNVLLQNTVVYAEIAG